MRANGPCPDGVEASPIRPRAEDLNLTLGEIFRAPEAPGSWAPSGDGRPTGTPSRRGGLPASPHQILGPRLGDGSVQGKNAVVSERLHGEPDPTREGVATRTLNLRP